MKADSRLRGWLKGLAATLVWGCIYSVGRFVFGAGGEAADPYLMAMYKFALGALALAPMLCRNGGWREAARAVRGDFPHLLNRFTVHGVPVGTGDESLKRPDLIDQTGPAFSIQFTHHVIQQKNRFFPAVIFQNFHLGEFHA